MSFELGNNVKIKVSGASHSESIDVTISGLPAGERIDPDEVRAFLKRRQGGNASYTTARKEADEPEILSGTETAGADPEKSDEHLPNACAASKKESELKRYKAALLLPHTGVKR